MAAKPRIGRPPKAQAGFLESRLLDAAAALFLKNGYGATSIEAVAAKAGISKRSFYARFPDKAALFAAVVHRLISQMRPERSAELFKGGTLEEILFKLSKVILHAALSPQALALHRVLTGESARFPELAAAVQGEQAREEAVTGIAKLLAHEGVKKPEFFAEQFLQMIIATPQRRAMGLGTPMTEAELDVWARDSIALLLKGCKA